MIVPSFFILFPLLVAFVLAALIYYKLNPERVVVSTAFAGMAAPLALLLLYLVLMAVGVFPSSWSGLYLVAALVTLGVTIARARVLRPKAA